MPSDDEIRKRRIQNNQERPYFNDFETEILNAAGFEIIRDFPNIEFKAAYGKSTDYSTYALCHHKNYDIYIFKYVSEKEYQFMLYDAIVLRGDHIIDSFNDTGPKIGLQPYEYCKRRRESTLKKIFNDIYFAIEDLPEEQKLDDPWGEDS